MVFINYSTKEISVKIVYYGPGLSGKTTNLQYIYKKTDKTFRGELVSLDTDTERTLFFDLLPMEVGKIRGFTTKIQLYTVPGQVHYNSTRKLVLKGVDGIVFVADSQKPILEADIGNYKNMLENLNSNHINIDKIPLVFQYNKRDLNNILPVDELNNILNPSNKPYFEAIAIKGKGVLETLREITRLTLRSVKEEVFGESIAAEEKRRTITEKEEIQEGKKARKEKKEDKRKAIKQKEETDIKEKETIEMDMVEEEPTQEMEREKKREEVIEQEQENIEVEDIELIEEQKDTEKIEQKEVAEEEVSKVKEEEEQEIREETEKEKEPKEEKKKQKRKEKESGSKEVSSIKEGKNLIEKKLSLKISSEKIIDSSYVYIQFTNQYGDIIKKWKISKEKIKDGAILSLNVDIDIK